MLQRLNNMCVNCLVKYYYLVVIEQSLDFFHELFFHQLYLEEGSDSLVKDFLFLFLQETLLGGSGLLSCHFKIMLKTTLSGYF